MHQRNGGFTLAELVLLIVIISIVASLAISTYQTYTVRSQVSEAIAVVSRMKHLVADAYSTNGRPPIDRTEAGLTPHPEDSRGSYVTAVAIVDGRIDITFGNNAHQEIAAQSVSLTPYLTSENTIRWRCGNAQAPSAATELAGSGVTARHLPATVDLRYLPGECR